MDGKSKKSRWRVYLTDDDRAALAHLAARGYAFDMAKSARRAVAELAARWGAADGFPKSGRPHRVRYARDMARMTASAVNMLSRSHRDAVALTPWSLFVGAADRENLDVIRKVFRLKHRGEALRLAVRWEATRCGFEPRSAW
jgi:enoyl-CoA hydratase/carnithine racemase